jgi:hypothetical protein
VRWFFSPTISPRSALHESKSVRHVSSETWKGCCTLRCQSDDIVKCFGRREMHGDLYCEVTTSSRDGAVPLHSRKVTRARRKALLRTSNPPGYSFTTEKQVGRQNTFIRIHSPTESLLLQRTTSVAD